MRGGRCEKGKQDKQQHGNMAEDKPEVSPTDNKGPKSLDNVLEEPSSASWAGTSQLTDHWVGELRSRPLPQSSSPPAPSATLLQDSSGKLHIVLNSLQQPNASQPADASSDMVDSLTDQHSTNTTVLLSSSLPCQSLNLQEMLVSLEATLKSREDHIRHLKESVKRKQEALDCLRTKSVTTLVNTDTEFANHSTKGHRIYSTQSSGLRNKARSVFVEGPEMKSPKSPSCSAFVPNGHDKEFIWLIGLDTVVENILQSK